MPPACSQPWGAHPCLTLRSECHPSFRGCPRNILILISLFRATLHCSGRCLVLVRRRETSQRPSVGSWNRKSSSHSRQDRQTGPLTSTPSPSQHASCPRGPAAWGGTKIPPHSHKPPCQGLACGLSVPESSLPVLGKGQESPSPFWKETRAVVKGEPGKSVFLEAGGGPRRALDLGSSCYQVSALPLASCMALSKLSSLSGPQLAHL